MKEGILINARKESGNAWIADVETAVTKRAVVALSLYCLVLSHRLIIHFYFFLLLTLINAHMFQIKSKMPLYNKPSKSKLL